MQAGVKTDVHYLHGREPGHCRYIYHRPHKNIEKLNFWQFWEILYFDKTQTNKKSVILTFCAFSCWFWLLFFCFRMPAVSFVSTFDLDLNAFNDCQPVGRVFLFFIWGSETVQNSIWKSVEVEDSSQVKLLKSLMTRNSAEKSLTL